MLMARPAFARTIAIGVALTCVTQVFAAPRPVTLMSINVTPATASIPSGTTRQFTATGAYSDGTTKDITRSVAWSSSTTSVATIQASGSTAGLATAKAVGSTTISATSGGIGGNATLQVTPAVLVSITVTPAKASVNTGSSVQFSAT